MEERKYSLLGIEMSFEEFDRLMCEQSQGKELKVENGQVVAVEHVTTQEELNAQRLIELKKWFDNYFDNQLKQSLWQSNFTISHDNYFDRDYNDIEELKTKAEEVRQEIKALQGKEPRQEITIEADDVIEEEFATEVDS